MDVWWLPQGHGSVPGTPCCHCTHTHTPDPTWVAQTPPRVTRAHRYRESIYMGDCHKSEEEARTHCRVCALVMSVVCVLFVCVFAAVGDWRREGGMQQC